MNFRSLEIRRRLQISISRTSTISHVAIPVWWRYFVLGKEGPRACSWGIWRSPNSENDIAHPSLYLPSSYIFISFLFGRVSPLSSVLELGKAWIFRALIPFPLVFQLPPPRGDFHMQSDPSIPTGRFRTRSC